jgi:hypothetical protein
MSQGLSASLHGPLICETGDVSPLVNGFQGDGILWARLGPL